MVRGATFAISLWLVVAAQATTIDEYNAYQFGSQSAALARCRHLWVSDPLEYLRQADKYERLDPTDPLFKSYRRGIAGFDGRWNAAGKSACGVEGLLSKFLGTSLH
ncbi:hypothetical protein [Mesorhizobium sp. L103C119B0]|uniref:hypothetical protein n=1 Tax=Mesorhizobium sp. L103C119B0 TaxID=1287085 RepID=UPI0012DD3195|nr:hypothetical protein [Mesorhizobium sp. L103C119B0]